MLGASATLHMLDISKPVETSQAIDALCPADQTPLARVYADTKVIRPHRPLRSETVEAVPRPAPATPEAEQAANDHLTAAIALKKDNRYSDELAELTGAIHLDPGMFKAYEMRANAWALQGRHDKALLDYDKAIEVGSILAYKWRASSEVDLGHYTEALADFEQAVRLNPTDPEIYKEHGFPCARFGRLRAAAGDFEIAANVDTGNHYAVIWRYLMQRKLGQDGAQAELERRAALLDLDVWPGPEVRLFLGQITPEELAPVPNSSQTDLQVYNFEAPYYRAEYHLFEGDKAKAIEELREVARINRYDYEEFTQAVAELARFEAEPASSGILVARDQHQR